MKFPTIHKFVKTPVFRHLIISGICGSADFFSFLLFSSFLKFEIGKSYILSFLISFTLGFIGHFFYTFNRYTHEANDLNQQVKKSLFLFIIQAILSLIIGYCFFAIYLNLTRNSIVSKLLQLASTFAFNFTFGRNVTFNANTK